MSDLLKIKVGNNNYLCKWTDPRYVEIGGRDYTIVKIGNQLWTGENLDYKFTKTDSNSSWLYYDNDETTYGWTGRKCGLLYNWYAAKDLNDNRNTLLPSGWRVPSQSDWDALLTAVGGRSTAGGKLKAANVSWASSWNGTDNYSFKALPAGTFSNIYGPTFSGIGTNTQFWTTGQNGNDGYYYKMQNNSSAVSTSNNYKTSHYSLRLVKDAL